MTDTHEETYENTFQTGPHAALTLRNVRGNVTIVGWERPEVSIVAVKKMGSEWGAHESFERTTIEMEQAGERVYVRTRYSNSSSIFGWIGIGRTPPVVHYTVKAPATCDISVRTVNGNLRISDVIGTIYLRSVDGSMDIKRVSGQVITSGVSADIHASDVGGSVAVHTVSGGGSFLQSQLSSFAAKCVSGDMQIETTIDPNGSYEMKSVDGSFCLRLPATSRATAEMTGVSGRASCALPCTVLQQERGRWRAEINGGGPTISLKSVSGELRIMAADIAPAANAPAPTPPVAAPAASASREWPEMDILKAVERGELTVEQAVAKLTELDKS
jgi:DUF4097 and DUF4098 domain-containing protein YvlB